MPSQRSYYKPRLVALDPENDIDLNTIQLVHTI